LSGSANGQFTQITEWLQHLKVLIYFDNLMVKLLNVEICLALKSLLLSIS
jgi:hypothetical protein